MNTDYVVIVSRRVATLREKVLKKISEGWQLAGGIAFNTEYNEYCQALYRQESVNQPAYERESVSISAD